MLFSQDRPPDQKSQNGKQNSDFLYRVIKFKYSKTQVKNMSEAVSRGKVEIEGLVITSDEEIKRFLNEGEKLLEKGELVQACEKMLKAFMKGG